MEIIKYVRSRALRIKSDKKDFATEVLLAYARRSHFFRNFLLCRKPLFCGLKHGKFDDQSKGSDKGSEYITFINHYSDNITISLELISVKNQYGYTTSQMVLIDFKNNSLEYQITRERINKMQDDLEL